MSSQAEVVVREFMASISPVLESTQNQLILKAKTAIRIHTLLESQKHDPIAWRDKSACQHIRRAVRYAVSALEAEAGDRNRDLDGDHLSGAICHLAMAMSVRNQPTP